MDIARKPVTCSSVAEGNVTEGTGADVGLADAELRPVPMLPARHVAVLTQLPRHAAIRLRWDVDTGWAALATAQPTAKPRFLGFAQLTAASSDQATRVTQVLGALRAAGFTVLADTAELDGLRTTWVRHDAPGSPLEVQPEAQVEPMTVAGAP